MIISISILFVLRIHGSYPSAVCTNLFQVLRIPVSAFPSYALQLVSAPDIKPPPIPSLTMQYLEVTQQKMGTRIVSMEGSSKAGAYHCAQFSETLHRSPTVFLQGTYVVPSKLSLLPIYPLLRHTSENP